MGERKIEREEEHSGSASTITNGPPAEASAILGVCSAPVLSCCCAASTVPLLSPAPQRTLAEVRDRDTHISDRQQGKFETMVNYI